MKQFGLLICLLVSTLSLSSQVGIGFTASTDLYTRFANPTDDIANRSSGSAILNIGAGPKIWFGNKNFSFSLEGQAILSPLAVSLEDSKGLGMLGIPIVARLNFKGLSGLNKLGTLGWSIGGGIQYNRSELFGLSEEFADLGVVREYQRLIIGQFGYGFGISGFTLHGILKYGFDPDSDASLLTIGVQYDFNLPKMKQIDDPASAL